MPEAAHTAQAAWQTFRNSQNCYSLRFPPQAVPDTADANAVRFVFAHRAQFGDGQDSIDVEYAFSIFAFPNPDALRPQQWFSRVEAGETASEAEGHRGLSDMIYAREKVRIDRSDGYRILIASFDDAKELVYVGTSTAMFELSFPTALPETQSDLDRYLPVLRTMVQTFTPTDNSDCHSKRRR